MHPEPETHDDNSDEDDFSEYVRRDMMYDLFPDPWSDECYDEEYRDEWKIFLREKSLAHVEGNTSNVDEECDRGYRRDIPLFRESKHGHECSSEDSSGSDKSRGKSWECSTDTSKKGSRSDSPFGFQEWVESKKYEDDREDDLEHVRIHLFDERSSDHSRYDARDTKKEKYPLIPVTIGESESARIPEDMIDRNEDDRSLIVE